MKTLGVTQFQQKKYKFLGFEGIWLALVGELTVNFVGIVYGLSSNGKTEFVMRLAKYLCTFGKVAWLSYEQRHDADLQRAINRNKMEEQAGIFFCIDPLAKRKKGKSKFEELDEYLGLRSTPDFIIIDSIDYLGLTLEQYFYLKEKYGGKKGIIFLAHEKDGKPENKTAQKIEYDGQFSFRCNKYIALKRKNRCGGMGDMVIWEEEARRLNPLYFKKLEA